MPLLWSYYGGLIRAQTLLLFLIPWCYSPAFGSAIRWSQFWSRQHMLLYFLGLECNLATKKKRKRLCDQYGYQNKTYPSFLLLITSLGRALPCLCGSWCLFNSNPTSLALFSIALSAALVFSQYLLLDFEEGINSQFIKEAQINP